MERRIRSLGEVYREHFRGGRKERMFISSVTFFLGFGAVRGLTHAIRRRLGPFHNLTPGGLHIHHAVWGINALLLIGYLWDAEIGVDEKQAVLSRLTSAGYGLAAALTLDEFALWLNLKDVYWLPQGRESIDAVVLFGGLLSAAWWGAPFGHDVMRELGKLRSLRDVGRLVSPVAASSSGPAPSA